MLEICVRCARMPSKKGKAVAVAPEEHARRDQGGVVLVRPPHVAHVKRASAVGGYSVNRVDQVKESAFLHVFRYGVHGQRDRVAHLIGVAVILIRAPAHAIRRRFHNKPFVGSQWCDFCCVDVIAVPSDAPVEVLLVLLRRVRAAGVGGGHGVRGGVQAAQQALRLVHAAARPRVSPARVRGGGGVCDVPAHKHRRRHADLMLIITCPVRLDAALVRVLRAVDADARKLQGAERWVKRARRALDAYTVDVPAIGVAHGLHAVVFDADGVLIKGAAPDPSVRGRRRRKARRRRRRWPRPLSRAGRAAPAAIRAARAAARARCRTASDNLGGRIRTGTRPWWPRARPASGTGRRHRPGRCRCSLARCRAGSTTSRR